ncbi:MAG: rod shape-determining protein MreD [Frankiales bacterium]|nr:rod shape-determining protein MreD [Frankiales bacterium]
MLVVLALLLQVCVLSRLPLPGTGPDLLVVLVVALALAGGPEAGAAGGFATGLGADLLGDGALGRLALAYAVVGHLVGLARADADRSVLVPSLLAAAAAGGAVLLFAGEGVLLGDPRVGLDALGRALLGTAAYAVVLTPLVVPPVRRLVAREDLDAPLSRRWTSGRRGSTRRWGGVRR